ncbi:nucleoside triphosphate pyrophosphohydrolase [Clostridium sp. D2Q-11]|uniref:Nucleoside triphosphate pyrophosphohydrolase n=1 Tax=Anaeromonas frigoriresistens TaxID=2683708 RepID=A0A942UZ77_9FIRM|nr:nucleoside triphosphate pyrophosphohydrolase [Anaeromonas frigoriresistens]MBS4539011.1 nucleoside triphosphate pyrophosphohydrolase [Anaeromonas frigoriresistens]
MSEKIYNKLIRDKIPQIIEENNKEYVIEKVNERELSQLLNKKLQEEVDEYLESEEVEELADILEVIHGILDTKNISFKELEKIRESKKHKRGGFSKGVKLIKVIE